MKYVMADITGKIIQMGIVGSQEVLNAIVKAPIEVAAIIDDSVQFDSLSSTMYMLVKVEDFGPLEYHWECVQRPANPLEVEFTPSGFNLLNTPMGSHLYIDKAWDNPHPGYELDEGMNELEFPHAGSHSIEIHCWPYLDKKFEVNI